ncbi:MAG: hypothetical protein JJU20_14405 [Opitutales bacterium]|nr:hypothetical protein [Opitutales bacterium]
MKYSFVKSGLLVVFYFITSLTVQANLRAPTLSFHGPVGSTFTQAEGIQVLNEELEIRFRIDRSGIPDDSFCAITARYRVYASDSADLGLEFVGSAEGELHWKLGDQSGVARLVAQDDTVSKTESESPLDDWQIQPALYSAFFTLAVEPGEQLIELQYKQPTSYMEVDYGYFRSSKFVHSVDYLIGPIKEWELAEDFEMRVQVHIEDAITGTWARMRSRDDRIWMVEEDRNALDPTEVVRERNSLASSWTFGAADLPDTVRVYVGPASKEGTETFQNY